MTDIDQELTDIVVSQAERMENLESVEDFDPLEVKATVSLRGTVRDIVAVTGTGGPHIEVNLSNGTVSGYWGNSEHTTHFKKTDVTEQLEDRFYWQFEDTVLA